MVTDIPQRAVSGGWQGYQNVVKDVVGASVRHECTKGGETWQYSNNRLEPDHRGTKGRLRVMRGLKGKDGASAARLITGVEEVRQHFRLGEKFKEQVSARERRRRYMLKLREWEESVQLVA